MDTFEGLRCVEYVAGRSDPVVDVEVGENAAAVIGLSLGELAARACDSFEGFSDGGGNGRLVHLDWGNVLLYVRCRGQHLDIGTRRDFTELGWQVIGELIAADLQRRGEVP